MLTGILSNFVVVFKLVLLHKMTNCATYIHAFNMLIIEIVTLPPAPAQQEKPGIGHQDVWL